MVSVIIPSYNHALFLEQRINTVLNQTFQDFEIIIIDDCSNDNSYELIERFRNNSKITNIIRNKSNSGNPFLQWKRGVELAQNDLIWIAESDDFCEKVFLEKLVPYFNDRSIVLAYCKSELADETGKITGVENWGKIESPEHWSKDYIVNGMDEFYKYQLKKNIVTNASSVLFRKSCFEKIQYFPEDITTAGDWLIWSQMMLMGKIAYKSESLNYFRIHDHTTRSLKSFEGELKKMADNLKVIEYFRKLTNKEVRIISNYKWLVDRWVSRFEIRLLFNKDYIFQKFSLNMLCWFYIGIIKRVFVIGVNKFK